MVVHLAAFEVEVEFEIEVKKLNIWTIQLCVSFGIPYNFW